MKKLFLTLSTIFVLMLSSKSYAIEVKMFKNLIENGNVAWSNCTYLTTGPEKPYNKKAPISDYIAENYRVAFVFDEIYYDIVIEKIKAPIEDGEKPVITESNIIDGIELAKKINLKEKGEVITDIEFVKWNSWNSFTLKIHNEIVKFRILEDQKVIVTSQ